MAWGVRETGFEGAEIVGSFLKCYVGPKFNMGGRWLRSGGVRLTLVDDSSYFRGGQGRKEGCTNSAF